MVTVLLRILLGRCLAIEVVMAIVELFSSRLDLIEPRGSRQFLISWEVHMTG